MTHRSKIYTSTFCLYKVKSLYGCQSVHLKCNISASRIQSVTNFGITSVRLFSFFNTDRNPHMLYLDQHDKCYFREQEKFIFPKYTSSHTIYNGARVARSLILLHFVDRCLLFVLSLLAIVLSAHLRFPDIEQPCIIFKLFLDKRIRY